MTPGTPGPPLQVARGGILKRNYVAEDYWGNPQVGKFVDTDILSGKIWPAGSGPDSALSVAISAGWIVSNDATWYFELHSPATSAIPTGRYRIQIVATRGADAAVLMDTDLIVTGTGGTLATPVQSPVAGTSPSYLATLYCTDEDIIKRCAPDFNALIPPSQVLAAGADGAFGVIDPWTITSGSNNFETQGVASGNIIWLRKPASAFGSPGQHLAVAAVNGANLTLRRYGMPANMGLAPSPAAGLTGVEFAIGTFVPQIEEASYSLNQRYGISVDVVGRSPTLIADLRVLRRACVAMVLMDRYSDETRQSIGDNADKFDMHRSEYSALCSEMEIRWSNRDADLGRTNWFSTRLVR